MREKIHFLKDDGLCKIIEELGEDALCDICRLHPRFFVEINDYSLAGVGLSCEKASELLFEKKSLNFIICDSQKTISFQELLKMLEIDISQDYLNLTNIIPQYLDEAKIKKILDIFCITEPIDSNWKNEVLLIKRYYKEYLNNLDIKKYEFIYQYILFRQLELTLNHGIKKIIDYAVYSIIFIMLYERLYHDDIEAVRRWSEQIEYNEDNIEIILNEVD